MDELVFFWTRLIPSVGSFMLLQCFMFTLLAGSTQEVPKPLAQWQVPVSPRAALVLDNGRSFLFVGDEVYEYSVQGSLERTFNLSMKAEQAYLSNEGTVWVHNGQNLLAGLNPSGSQRWQIQIPTPTVAPVSYRDFFVYSYGNRIAILDPKDGSVRFSMERNEALNPVAVLDGWLYFHSEDGKTISWSPEAEIHKERFNKVKKPGDLKFLARSSLGDMALCFSEGTLQLVRADEKPLWNRNFNIDIHLPPIFVNEPGKRKEHILVATRGRNVFSFGLSHGEQLARTLLPNRPLQMTRFSQDKALIITWQQPLLLWYHSEEARFEKQQLENPILQAAQSRYFLLLIDGNGIIRLYKKDLPRTE